MYLAIVLVLSLLLFVFDTGSFPLISPDEPRYAETAREMIESGDFLSPICNYLPRFDKPILFYWLEVLSFKVFGINEFAARFPSVLAGSGMVWLSYILASRHGFPLLSASITSSTLVFFLCSKLSITDMVLCFFISAALVFFYLGYSNRLERKQKFALGGSISSKWFISTWIMMGLGFLTKGPIAVFIPILVIFLFLFFVKDLRSFFNHTKTELWLGFLGFLLISLPWYVYIHFKTNAAFTREFFFNHNIERYLQEHSGHGEPFWFFLPVLLVSLLPWTVFLPQSLFSFDYSQKYNLQSSKSVTQRLIGFSIIWFLVVFLFFSLSQTKLVTYILPGILPLNFLVARWWHEKFKSSKSSGYENMDLIFGLVFFAVLMLGALVLSLTVFKPALLKLDAHAFILPIIIIASVCCAASIIAMTAALHQAVVSFNFLLFASIFSYLVLNHFIFKPYALYRDSGSKYFMQNLKASEKLTTLKIHQTRFCFYGKRKVEKLGKKQLYSYLTENTDDEVRYFVSKHRYIQGFERFLDKKIAPSMNGSDLFIDFKNSPRLFYGKAML